MTSYASSNRPGESTRRTIVGERRGAMLVFVAVSMVVLLGFLSLTLDVGSGNRQRRMAQTAADAGALGGGTEILRNPSASNATVTAAAIKEAKRNGFETGGATLVTVNYAPLSGPHTDDLSYLEVIVSRTHPTIFGRFLNLTSLNVGARAVAGVGSYGLTCVYSLAPDIPNALNIVNGANLVTNCGAAINSSDGTALNLNTSGDFDAGTGTITVSGGWTGRRSPTPAPGTNAPVVLDPLRNTVKMPSPPAPCTSTGLLTISQDTVLNPGVYCGGISATNRDVTLNPGTYIMRGGGITVKFGRFHGTGVTIINSIDLTSTYAFAPIYFGNGCKTKLLAPTDGDFKGILMFGDPAGPANAINTFACSSDDSPELTGALYFPTQTFIFNGSNTGTTLLGAIIAYQVEIGGRVTIINDTSTGSSALKRLSLVE